MSKIKQTNKLYHSIEIPKQLNTKVDSAIERAIMKRESPYVWVKPLIYAASVCILFVGAVNSSRAFAESIYNIPVLGNVARIITFREYEESNEGYHISINEPVIEDTGNTALEKQINKEIQSRVNIIIENAKKRAEENKQMIIEKGRSLEEQPYFTVDVDYEVKSSTDSILSFVVNDTESFANTYTYQTFYNINLETGNEVKITDILGKNYREIIAKSIEKQVKQRILEHPDFMYNDFDDNADFIFENLKFFINSDGNIVISFDKGEIAPPPMGLQEFEIIK